MLPRVRSATLFTALLIAGCIGHKQSAKLVDPVLLDSGTTYSRDGGKRANFDIGPYHFEQVALERSPEPHASTGLSPDGLSRPAERIDLDLKMSSKDTSWSGRCKALREPTGRSDYAAVTDEFHDVVEITCTFSNQADARWSFAMKGSLATNLGGTLKPEHADFVGGRLEVEVLMWRTIWNRVRRHVPHAIGQVRMQKTTTAAMLLARPEQLWIAADAPSEMLEVSLITLGALRMLPMGFEG